MTSKTQSAGQRAGRRLWLALAVVALLVGGYFAVTAAVRAHVDGVIAGALDKPLPEFTLTARDGRQWTAADLRGRRVVLHFFRSRCAACAAEAPEICALEQQLPEGVVLLHVMTDRVMGFDEALTRATLAHDGFAAPVLMADAGFMDAFHSVAWSKVTPITYVVDAAGMVRFGLLGLQSRAAILAALAELS